MNRQRNILLGVCTLLFLSICVALIYRRISYNQTHFQVGSIPSEITNELLPKNIPIDSIRPPALRITDPIRYGNATSIVSVIEFGDFQCEFCRQMSADIKHIVENYGGTVRFVWRDLPIEDSHTQALPAAIFARCAGIQGKYWEAFDALMASPTLNDGVYKNIATRLKLNTQTLDTCKKDPSLGIEATIRKDVQSARADGIQSAPFIFIGTKAFEGQIDPTVIRKTIDESLSSL